jgi:SusD family.
VRRRAWGKPIDQISEYDYDTSEGDLLSVIVKEREKELCLEGRLFFDYLRLGLDRELFASRGYNPEIHHRLPIPQAERQIVGMDKLLQNKGY